MKYWTQVDLRCAILTCRQVSTSALSLPILGKRSTNYSSVILDLDNFLNTVGDPKSFVTLATSRDQWNLSSFVRYIWYSLNVLNEAHYETSKPPFCKTQHMTTDIKDKCICSSILVWEIILYNGWLEFFPTINFCVWKFCLMIFFPTSVCWEKTVLLKQRWWPEFRSQISLNCISNPS